MGSLIEAPLNGAFGSISNHGGKPSCPEIKPTMPKTNIKNLFFTQDMLNFTRRSYSEKKNMLVYRLSTNIFYGVRNNELNINYERFNYITFLFSKIWYIRINFCNVFYD